jgi:heme O synthase-like polyprenyltransferase
MIKLALQFLRDRERGSARKLFLFTLLYLPISLALLIVGWRVA